MQKISLLTVCSEALKSENLVFHLKNAVAQITICVCVCVCEKEREREAGKEFVAKKI